MPRGGALEVLGVALRLGCTSFGGPVAHLGYFREAYVEQRKWLTEEEFGEFLALCQFLPGPASSQTHFAIGMHRAGVLGGLAAWVGFTLPSALLLVAFAYGLWQVGTETLAGALLGFKIAAVAVVAHAVWGMGLRLCPDRARVTVALLAAAVMLAVAAPWMQVLVIAGGALWGARWLRQEGVRPVAPEAVRHRRAWMPLLLFALLLVGLPLATHAGAPEPVAVADGFYRSGALVFGGGHVVLPLLEQRVVEPGWVDRDTFLAGYGAAQAIPGPLFAFSAFLGASMQEPPVGFAYGTLCLLALFLPGCLLVMGIAPLWARMSRWSAMVGATRGANAAVVGLLLAALYHPVWTSAIYGPRGFALALLAFGCLRYWGLPAWLVVFAAALLGHLGLVPLQVAA